MKPNSITVSRSKRGTVIKASGLAAQALFDKLAVEVDARLNVTGAYPCTVTFEDHGQDFLEWDIDEHGRVADSRPLQASVWCGARLQALPVAGQCLSYRSPTDDQVHRIRYPVKKVTQRLKPAAAQG